MPEIEGPVAFIPQGAHGLPGRLGFAPAPGLWQPRGDRPGGDAMDEDLTFLQHAYGATVLVTLLEEAEMSRIGLARLPQRARSSGFEWLWLPIADGAAPTDLEATSVLVARMLERLAAGRTVVVHCHGGIGRSGTISACALVAAGLEPRRALEVVREARAGAATAPGQEGFVYEFVRACARATKTPGPGTGSPRNG